MMKQGMQVTVVCVLLLGGCATPNKPQTTSVSATAAPTDAQAAWQQRQTQFARMGSWRMDGRVGVQLRDQSASFGVSWLQQGNDQYEMNIKNPLTGTVMAVMKGTATDVTLQANGKTYRDADAERLLQAQTGVSLPLSGMKYWVRGVSSPNAPVGQVKLDAQGRPVLLQQSGWRIEYMGWRGNAWDALPEKVSLSRSEENARVKVIAKEWQTRL